MRQEKLLEALEKIEEEWIEEAAPENKPPKKKAKPMTWVKWGTIADCALVIVGIGVPHINQYGEKLEETNFESSNATTTIDMVVKEEVEDTIVMDKEPMVELTLEEAIRDGKFGNLFPSDILDGYVLQDTVSILNHKVLVANFYNEELEDELTIRIAKKDWFYNEQKDLKLNTILYREKGSGMESYIYIAGEENIVQYVFSNTDIADNKKFYEMVYSASYFHTCIEYADKEDKGFPNWGLTLSVKNVTESGLTLVCTQSGGEPTGELQTGSEYHLIVLKDGTWQDVPTIIDEYGWNTIAYIVEKNDSTEFEIKWEWLYGKLPTGTYRLTKGFTDFRKSGDYDNFTYWTEFEIK